MKKERDIKEDNMDEMIKEALKKEDSEQEMHNEDETDSIDSKQQDDKQSELDQIEQEKKEINEKYLRLAADFQNYKRRIENEKKEIRNFANEAMVCELLNVLDNFERAFENTESEDESFSEGIKMIYKQLFDTLSNAGLEVIETENKEFDPNFHHAVMKEPSDTFDSNMIIEAFQKGYTFNGKVIRPSMVKVAE